MRDGFHASYEKSLVLSTVRAVLAGTSLTEEPVTAFVPDTEAAEPPRKVVVCTACDPD